MHGHADRPALVRDRARDRLADPPRRVRRELEALAVVELLRRAHEPDRPLLDQVEEREPLVAVALRDRDDEAEVRLDHRLLRRVLAALDALRELDLLRRGEQRNLADVLQEELQRVGRDLRLGLDLGLGLVAARRARPRSAPRRARRRTRRAAPARAPARRARARARPRRAARCGTRLSSSRWPSSLARTSSIGVRVVAPCVSSAARPPPFLVGRHTVVTAGGGVKDATGRWSVAESPGPRALSIVEDEATRP